MSCPQTAGCEAIFCVPFKALVGIGEREASRSPIRAPLSTRLPADAAARDGLICVAIGGAGYLRCMFRRHKPSRGDDGKALSSAATLRPLLYGDVPVARWGVDAGEEDPWDRFSAARHAVDLSDMDAAVAIWRDIAASPGLESRQYLQAWTFLRQAGNQPPADQAKRALGVVTEMPMKEWHDVLAAYQDGSCRYLNHSGKVAVIEDRSIEEVQVAVTQWLDVGRSLAQAIGPWDRPELPVVPPGHMRITVLTPSGPHFGQGPQQQMMADPTTSTFVGAATALLQVVVSLTVDPAP